MFVSQGSQGHPGVSNTDIINAACALVQDFHSRCQSELMFLRASIPGPGPHLDLGYDTFYIHVDLEQVTYRSNLAYRVYVELDDYQTSPRPNDFAPASASVTSMATLALEMRTRNSILGRCTSKRQLYGDATHFPQVYACAI
jgi:hypothetical protein